MSVDNDYSEFFLSINHEKLYFGMVQIASSILNRGKEIKLLQRLMANILLNKSISR